MESWLGMEGATLKGLNANKKGWGEARHFIRHMIAQRILLRSLRNVCVCAWQGSVLPLKPVNIDATHSDGEQSASAVPTLSITAVLLSAGSRGRQEAISTVNHLCLDAGTNWLSGLLCCWRDEPIPTKRPPTGKNTHTVHTERRSIYPAPTAHWRCEVHKASAFVLHRSRCVKVIWMVCYGLMVRRHKCLRRSWF